MNEENIISAEESITGEEIDLTQFDEDSAKKVRDLHAGFTRRMQEFARKEKEYLEQINALREIEKEYNELLNFQPFIEWAKSYKEKSEKESEDYDYEEAKIPKEFKERLDNIERSIMIENIKAEIEDINSESEELGLPKVEGEVFDTMLKIAKTKAENSPDGKCHLTTRELYYLAIKDKLRDLLVKEEKVPFFETTSGRGGEQKKGLFESVIEVSRRKTI